MMRKAAIAVVVIAVIAGALYVAGFRIALDGRRRVMARGLQGLRFDEKHATAIL